MRAGSWLDELRAQGVRRVAAALGLHVDDAPRRGLRPCPACGAERRGSTDRRPPAEVTSDGGGWHCYRCDGKGNAVSLAAWRILQTAEPTRDGWAELHRTLAQHGLVEGIGAGPAKKLPPPPPPAPPPPPRRPPTNELAALWSACVPVSDDSEVASFIRLRGLDPFVIDDFKLARALPKDTWMPRWAECDGWTWIETGYRLVLPMYNHLGRLESLHARCIVQSDRPKGLSPTGFTVVGLVLADALTRLLLSGAPLGDGSESAEAVRQNGLVIAEGVPDFLTWAAHSSDANASAPAVMGIISGSFTEAIANRIPDGCPIASRCHPDKAGDKYTDRIRSLLSHRCSLNVLQPENSIGL